MKSSDKFTKMLMSSKNTKMGGPSKEFVQSKLGSTKIKAGAKK